MSRPQHINILAFAFDPDLWSTDLIINREHLIIKDYPLTMFEAL